MAECPRCGAKVKLISGIKCPKCDHTVGMQSLDTDWKQYDPDLGRQRVKGSDEQTRPERRYNPKRRHPLK